MARTEWARCLNPRAGGAAALRGEKREESVFPRTRGSVSDGRAVGRRPGGHEFRGLTTLSPEMVEHAQGFFVKHGDGGVDTHVIANLFKRQVCQLARYLGAPEAIQ